MTNETWTLDEFTIQGVNKRECQDAALVVKSSHGLFLAVADGLGSHSHSALGAQMAMRILSAEVSAYDDVDVPSDPSSCRALAEILLNRTVEAWESWAVGLGPGVDGGPNRHNVKTTFAFGVLRPPWLAVRSIGDSLVIAASGDHVCDLLLGANRDEGGGTASIGAHEAGDVTRLDVYDPELSTVMLATDGFERAIRVHSLPTPCAGRSHYVDLDPAVDKILRGLRQRVPVGEVRKSVEQGLVLAPGAKGDDVGIAVASRRNFAHS
jgi:hypothetical protein